MVESLVRIAQERAKEAGARRVTRIGLAIGETTGYMKDSLDFYFEVLSKGTMLEGATLTATYIKPSMTCPSCGLEYQRARFSFACPSCGADGAPTQKGTEFYIEDMDIEAAGEESR